MTTPTDTVADVAGREAVTMLRAKMGPMLRSDEEARLMLFWLSKSPAVHTFAAQLSASNDIKGDTK